MLPRYAHNIYQVHIADGFTSDCDELIHKCLQYQTLHFHTFCEIWKDMHFGMIYHGRNSGAEIAELSEEVIHIAKQYMVKDSSNFEETVAGLFLVYGLLTLQPFPKFALLRIIPADVPAINRIQVVARREKRLDVLYILGEVLVKYSQYHAAQRDHGMESNLRKYLEGYTSIDKLGVRPRGVFYKQNEELDIIRDLGNVTRQYTRAKNSLINQRDVNLKYIDENLATELNTTLKQVIHGIIDYQENSDDEAARTDDESTLKLNTDQHSDSVRAIKDKAMKNTVNSIKHLTGIEDRKQGTGPSTATSPERKAKLKSSSGKIKTSSPKKRRISPRKKKTETQPTLEAEAKARLQSAIQTKIEIQSLPDTDDLNIEEFCKGINKKTTIKTYGKKMNIEFEALPLTIHTDKGREVEIEFIDNAEAKTLKVEEDVPSPMKKQKRVETTIIQKNIVQKKPRSRILSRYKKMGMLPVANFEGQK